MQQDVDLDQLGLLLAALLVVERRVAAGSRLQQVEEVEDDLGQRQRVAQLDAVLGQVVHAEQLSAAALAQLHDRADELTRRQDRRAHDRLVNRGDLPARELAGVGDDDLAPSSMTTR